MERNADDGVPVTTTLSARSLLASSGSTRTCRTLFRGRKRLLQGPLDGLLSDLHVRDLVLIEELLDLAVRNGVDLGEAQPQELDQHHAKEGRKEVPDRKVVLCNGGSS